MAGGFAPGRGAGMAGRGRGRIGGGPRPQLQQQQQQQQQQRNLNDYSQHFVDTGVAPGVFSPQNLLPSCPAIRAALDQVIAGLV